MKFLLIGNGFIAPKHKEAIKETNGEIAGVVEEKDDWQEEIKKTDADCTVILTPNDLHFEMAKFSAEQGKIVLCEKPLVIKSEHAKILVQKSNIFVVHQLRYHPFVEEIRGNKKENGKNKVEMDISVYRDEKYFQSWKGKKERSGGPLFNLGIHYFDLLLYLLGNENNVKTTFLNERTGEGIIEGNDYTCDWRVSIDEKRDNQRRIFKINGINYNFSSKDNLSYENLHRFVYQDLLNKEGVTPGDALKSIELVEKLHRSYEK